MGGMKAIGSAAASMLGFGGNAIPSFRFMVIMGGIPMALFTEITLPTLQVETTDIWEGGQNEYQHHLPLRVNAGNVTLKRGITSMMEFMEWYKLVQEGDIVNAKKDVTVVFFNVAHIPTIVWNFRDAYPIKWSGPQLTSSSQDIAIEELELVHHGFEFENF